MEKRCFRPFFTVFILIILELASHIRAQLTHNPLFSARARVYEELGQQ